MTSNGTFVELYNSGPFLEPEDTVNHPSHYADTSKHGGDMECIDWIKACLTSEEYQGYLRGAALKYIWRYKDKSHAIEDLEKAQWYLNRVAEDIFGSKIEF